MAYNYKAPILAVTMAVILLAAANPVADAQATQLFNVINTVGRICCAANGSCLGGAPGVPGVVVSLNCSRIVGATVTVGQGTTNATGYFNISVRNVEGILSSQGTLPCVATFNLPLTQTVCPVLRTTTGTLVGALTFVNSVVSTVTGLVANFIVTVFVNVQLPV